MSSEKAREYYLVFISIVFGIFVTSWAEPIIRTLKSSDSDSLDPVVRVGNAVAEVLNPRTNDALQVNLQTNLAHKLTTNVAVRLALPSDLVTRIRVGEALTEVINSETNPPLSHELRTNLLPRLTSNIVAHLTPTSQEVRTNIDRYYGLSFRQWLHGFLTLLVIISLWWWYGVFLRWFAPAEGFVMYLYDFISLSCFAVATGLWSSVGKGFPDTVSLASVLICGRFAAALGATKKIPRARKVLFRASMVVAGIGIFSFACWIGAKFSGGSAGTFFKDATIVFMFLSLAVTAYAVNTTEGFGWRREFLPSSLEMPDRLIPPLKALRRIKPMISYEAIRNLQHRAYVEFQQQCVTIGLHKCGSDLHSAVHSTEDLDSQVLLCACASNGSAEDMLKRFKVMYFVHWLDDVVDQDQWTWCRLARHFNRIAIRVCSSEEITYEKIFTGPLKRHKALADIIHDWFSDPACFELGIRRLIIGSLVFKEGDFRTKARGRHKVLMAKLGIRNGLLEDPDMPFIDLSTKTLLEFWHGMERSDVDHEYVFLFSLLYGPGLYYHDVEEERLASEHSENWGLLDAKIAAEYVKKIGTLLEAKINHDPRADGRVLEVTAFVECFSNVLPAQVKAAYDHVVQQLDARLHMLKEP